MFSGNIFEGTFNIDVVINSPPPKTALMDNMALTVNKCVKLKSKLQYKYFMFLKSVIYLGVSTAVLTVLIKVNDLKIRQLTSRDFPTDSQ